MANLIEEYAVTDVYIKVKFGVTVKVSTITNSHFTLTYPDATPSTVPSPHFKTIDLANNYNSISRILYLYFEDGVLDPDTSYRLTISGLTNPAGTVFATESFDFETDNIDTTTEDTENIPDPFPEPVIVDYSLTQSLPDFAVDIEQGASASSSMSLESSDPVDGMYYLFPDEGSVNGGPGVVELRFNYMPDESDLGLIKVQKRLIKKAPTRWENVNANVMLAPAMPPAPWVWVQFPANDHYPEAATPLDTTSPIYDEAGFEYFDTNYKYRIIIPKGLRGYDDDATVTEYKVIQDIEVLLAGVLDPMYISTDELETLFPDASPVEIAEQIFYYSSEVKKLLKLEDDVEEIPFVAMEYIKAAVACSLDKIYGVGGNGANYSFTLGDLTVNRGKGSVASSSNVTRANATTWCEIAGVLRGELTLINSRGGFRSVVRGSRYLNPIPVRKIREQDPIIRYAFEVPVAQGQIDEEA